MALEKSSHALALPIKTEWKAPTSFLLTKFRKLLPFAPVDVPIENSLLDSNARLRFLCTRAVPARREASVITTAAANHHQLPCLLGGPSYLAFSLAVSEKLSMSAQISATATFLLGSGSSANHIMSGASGSRKSPFPCWTGAGGGGGGGGGGGWIMPFSPLFLRNNTVKLN